MKERVGLLFSFDEAFALLIREIETIKRDVATKSSLETAFLPLSHQLSTKCPSSNDARDQGMCLLFFRDDLLIHFFIKQEIRLNKINRSVVRMILW